MAIYELYQKKWKPESLRYINPRALVEIVSCSVLVFELHILFLLILNLEQQDWKWHGFGVWKKGQQPYYSLTVSNIFILYSRNPLFIFIFITFYDLSKLKVRIFYQLLTMNKPCVFRMFFFLSIYFHPLRQNKHLTFFCLLAGIHEKCESLSYAFVLVFI